MTENKTSLRTDHPLSRIALERLDERLSEVKRRFACPMTWQKGQSAKPQSADLILSLFSLGQSGNLLEELRAVYESLKPEGLFLAALIGGESLQELRDSLMQAELDLRGGAAARMAALSKPEDMGNALTQTGFAHPVVDHESFTLLYDNIFALLQDLRTQGCTYKPKNRTGAFAPRNLFARASLVYHERFATPEGKIPATVDMIFLHGWRE
ncbi:MAG: hypothetical protein EOM37_02710 [Proteobacteria bacterium]|nr:hypothetical protein [Pseudomonadota bacterium]